VQYETGDTARSPAAVDVPGGAPEVERPGGASRGASQSLRGKHCRKAERKNDSGEPRRHREQRLQWRRDALFADDEDDVPGLLVGVDVSVSKMTS
jgi:hypothetical protein